MTQRDSHSHRAYKRSMDLSGIPSLPEHVREFVNTCRPLTTAQITLATAELAKVVGMMRTRRADIEDAEQAARLNTTVSREFFDPFDNDGGE